MKKNISINISGIIFHIEEDGYDQLKEYLESIHRYFSTYDDSTEIIADIENRIAEIFLSKLKEDRQVITLEDVEELKATMGGIKDFKAVEMEEEPESEEEELFVGEEDESTYSRTAEAQRKLYRDEKRKILGGVLAGIAHYFTIDPLWIRLIFILLFLGISILPQMGAVLFIAYILMWIIVPGTYELEEQKAVKKMFRNPDDKVFGGVCSGISAYFGMDPVVIRLIFVLLIFFGGTGVILYLILWIILPEARTLTDKMEMQGEPVTLKNIETNIKKSLKVGQEGEESIWVRILLFPFRLIAEVFSWISKILGPLATFFVEAIRVIFGLILVITAISVTIALIIVGAAAIGLYAGSSPFMYWDFPMDLLLNQFTIWPVLGILFSILIPQIFLVILGISIIAKQLFLNAKVGWSLFALWIISVGVVAFTLPPIINDFRNEGEYKQVETYNLEGKTAVLQLNEVGLEDYRATTLRIRGHQDPDIILEQRFEAKGRTRQSAADNAQMVTYGVSLQDSIFTFDSNIQFKEDARFRDQKLRMVLYMPYGQKFILDENLEHILRNTLYPHGYNAYQMEGNVWAFNEDGLTCLTCEEDREKENIDEDEDQTISFSGDEKYRNEFAFRDFDALDVSDFFKIDIVQNDEFEVIVKSEHDVLDRVNLSMENNSLKLRMDASYQDWMKKMERVVVYISMPELSSVIISGASEARISGFDESDLYVELSGAAFADMDVNVQDLQIHMDGATKMELSGNGNDLRLKATGASSFKGFEYTVRNGSVESAGVATVRINAVEELELEMSGASHVRYMGSPRTITNRSRGTTLTQE
jgi:phage shock protein PspC (stress-responsive transcriptional regulator)